MWEYMCVDTHGRLNINIYISVALFRVGALKCIIIFEFLGTLNFHINIRFEWKFSRESKWVKDIIIYIVYYPYTLYIKYLWYVHKKEHWNGNFRVKWNRHRPHNSAATNNNNKELPGCQKHIIKRSQVQCNI